MAWTRLQTFPTYGRTYPLCSGCGSPQRRDNTRDSGWEDVFDTGCDIDLEGNVVICEQCMIEASHMLGFAPPDKVQAVQAAADEATALLERAKDIIDDKEILISAQGREMERLRERLRERLQLAELDVETLTAAPEPEPAGRRG